MTSVVSTRWWQRDDLYLNENELEFAGRKVGELAEQFDSPAFFYSGRRVTEKLSAIHQALNSVGFSNRFKIHYAMKANRFAPLLTHLKHSGLCGIDACSPAEIQHAISCGFDASDISFTATSLSQKDLQQLARYKDVFINCDSLHTIRRIGELCPGREIGIRINPEVGIGYAENQKLRYSGAASTKFGIYRDQFEQALLLAKKYNLSVRKIHFHTGCGYLNQQLEEWDNIISECLWFIDKVDSLTSVNVGGGLGVPHTESDKPLDLAQWANVLAKHFLERSLSIEIEPGDYLLKDAGILLLTVNSVEQKKQTTFVGLDAGFNVALEPVMYGLPFLPVPVKVKPGEEEIVTLVGNINEAMDVWYRDISLPALHEGDYIALINAGAYSSSMASNHCMRGDFREFLLL